VGGKGDQGSGKERQDSAWSSEWRVLSALPPAAADPSTIFRSPLEGLMLMLYLNADLKKMRNPPYSPDLAPSDYQLFLNLKKHLNGQRF